MSKSASTVRVSPLPLMVRAVVERTWLISTSLFKLIVGWAHLSVMGVFYTLILLVLLPSRMARIKMCNRFGTITGRFMVWLTGSDVTLLGGEHLDSRRPAIYVANHASVLDIFIAIWLAPTGTVGVAKKEIVYYPVFGWLYYLSGHLRIDRGNSKSAVAGVSKLGRYVRDKALSIIVFPEGTRSRTGRLLPFKKGVVHLACQTGLPVVPLVVKGTHKCWEKRTHTVRAVPITVEVLPPVDTSHWSVDAIDAALEEIHALYRDHLDEDQRPL